MSPRQIIRLPLETAPAPPNAETRAGLRLLITVPESWCYHLRREPPPGGWTKALRSSLREGVFPEPIESLWWDEMVHPDGSWELWALQPKRLEPALPSTWEGWRRVQRICPEGQDAAQAWSAFPNLAPPDARPRRWPWRALGLAAAWGIPPLTVTLLATGVWQSRARQIHRFETETLRLRQEVLTRQEALRQERLIAERLERGTQEAIAPFLRDLDALTRLVPEDGHALELLWEADGVQVELLTPRPDPVREALEASPEFAQVRLLGDLQRQGAQTRLRLAMIREGR